jgi:hypothetical protein
MTATAATLAFIDRQRRTLRAELERLDEAAAVLGSRGGKSGQGPSVRSRIIEAIEAEDRHWTASELLEELVPLGGSDPLAHVRTVLTKLVNGGLAVRVAPDTVRAARFVRDDSERVMAV